MVKEPETKNSESSKIESANLMEESREIFESCIKCGMCKSICPTFKILREERISARGIGIVFSNKAMEKIFFECTMCKACEQKCPLNIKICEAILKGREAMVLRDKGLKSNEEMIENIRKTGNPFGEDAGKGTSLADDKLYCC